MERPRGARRIGASDRRGSGGAVIGPLEDERLVAITYSSFAAPGLQQREVEAILDESRRNNGRDSITGLLLFNGAMFVQTIEGPRPAMQGLMGRLATDPRHCQMTVRDERPLDRRIFADWAMGFVSLHSGRVEGQRDVVEALARPMPAAIHDLLLSLATTLPFG